MRRRALAEGHLWLKWWPSETGKLTVYLRENERRTAEDALHILGGTYHLLVELRQDKDRFDVRCYPLPGQAALGLPEFAVSMSGASLPEVLAALVREYDRAYLRGDKPALHGREVSRWVVS